MPAIVFTFLAMALLVMQYTLVHVSIEMFSCQE